MTGLTGHVSSKKCASSLGDLAADERVVSFAYHRRLCGDIVAAKRILFAEELRSNGPPATTQKRADVWD
jgi:hypothetical protein